MLERRLRLAYEVLRIGQPPRPVPPHTMGRVWAGRGIGMRPIGTAPA